MTDSRLNRTPPLTPSDVDSWSIKRGQHRSAPQRINIPVFPAFKPLEITDQFEIVRWTNHFLPYSDFNFVSLWCWNTAGECEISWLNDNLVVLFNDYVSGERFFSFIGTNEVATTAERLLDLASQRGMVDELRLIPAETADELGDHPSLVLLPTPEHADYVLSTFDWSQLRGKSFRNKRNEISRFEKAHTPVCREIDLSDTSVQQAVMTLFGRWIVEKQEAGKPQTVIESQAIGRVFSLYRPQDLLALGLFTAGEMIGFSINERINADYSMGHFWKVVGDFPGAYAFMLRHTCQILASEGITLHNIQQDLGDPGLAMAKRLYRPDRYLDRFQITREAEAQPSYPTYLVEFMGDLTSYMSYMPSQDFAHVG